MTVINHGGQCPVQSRIVGVNIKFSPNMAFIWAFIQILFRLEYGWIKKKSCFMETIFSGPSFGVRSNCSEDKSGMWVGSAKNDWNLTSSMKMSPFRVKYGYNIMKNNSGINLWPVLYVSVLVHYIYSKIRYIEAISLYNYIFCKLIPLLKHLVSINMMLLSCY